MWGRARSVQPHVRPFPTLTLLLLGTQCMHLSHLPSLINCRFSTLRSSRRAFLAGGGTASIRCELVRQWPTYPSPMPRPSRKADRGSSSAPSSPSAAKRAPGSTKAQASAAQVVPLDPTKIEYVSVVLAARACRNPSGVLAPQRLLPCQ